MHLSDLIHLNYSSSLILPLFPGTAHYLVSHPFLSSFLSPEPSLLCYPLVVLIFLPDQCSGVETRKLFHLSLQSFPHLSLLFHTITMGRGWAKSGEDALSQSDGIIKLNKRCFYPSPVNLSLYDAFFKMQTSSSDDSVTQEQQEVHQPQNHFKSYFHMLGVQFYI